MTRTWIVALMAATALVPAIAMAQDVERGRWEQRQGGGPGRDNGPGGQRDGGDQRGPRPDRQPQQQAQPQPPQPQQPQQQAQPDANRGGWNGQRGNRDQARGNWNGQRPDRGPGDDRQAQAQARGNPGGWSPDRGPRPGGPGGDPRRDGYRDGQRGQWAGNDRRGDVRQQWNRSDADWRDQARGAQGFADRSAWNRGWRQNDRYDYGRYRSANRGAYRMPRYYAPGGWNAGYRRFSVGVTLNQSLWGQNYWIDDAYDYRLPEAYGPYRWVRYYNDALLVDIRNGRVVDSVYDIFW